MLVWKEPAIATDWNSPTLFVLHIAVDQSSGLFGLTAERKTKEIKGEPNRRSTTDPIDSNNNKIKKNKKWQSSLDFPSFLLIIDSQKSRKPDRECCPLVPSSRYQWRHKQGRHVWQKSIKYVTSQPFSAFLREEGSNMAAPWGAQILNQNLRYFSVVVSVFVCLFVCFSPQNSNRTSKWMTRMKVLAQFLRFYATLCLPFGSRETELSRRDIYNKVSTTGAWFSVGNYHLAGDASQGTRALLKAQPQNSLYRSGTHTLHFTYIPH